MLKNRGFLARARDIDTIYIIVYYTEIVNRFLKISFIFLHFFALFSAYAKSGGRVTPKIRDLLPSRGIDKPVFL